ncbi:Tfp pilus assembly protein FimT/FimU [Sulfurimonas sp.]|uniref:pilus assembly FimT family protein n=1 Tax=Sulfurimonas sp. TaxID=2022749 RepID=UPI003562E392
MRKRTLHRLAFTLIELIFAIVIIAVSVMSLPMMTQVTSSGMEKNLVQEAIFASVAEINLATTYVWDERSLLSSDADDLSKVVPTTGAADDCNASRKRPGHINRICIEDITTIPGLFTGTIDENSSSLEVAGLNSYKDIYTGTTEASGYKLSNYKSKLDVTRCGAIYGGNCQDFGLEADNINLKEITVTVQNDKNETVMLLRTYSANIGEVAYESEPL